MRLASYVLDRRIAIIAWPALSSTTQDYTVAMEYATANLRPNDAAVVLKIHTSTVHPIQPFSYFAYEEEMLYEPCASFRVTGLWSATTFNLRQGVQLASAAERFTVSTEHLVQGMLSLDEARKQRVVLITMVEQPLGDDTTVLDAAVHQQQRALSRAIRSLPEAPATSAERHTLAAAPNTVTTLAEEAVDGTAKPEQLEGPSSASQPTSLLRSGEPSARGNGDATEPQLHLFDKGPPSVPGGQSVLVASPAPSVASPADAASLLSTVAPTTSPIASTIITSPSTSAAASAPPALSGKAPGITSPASEQPLPTPPRPRAKALKPRAIALAAAASPSAPVTPEAASDRERPSAAHIDDEGAGSSPRASRPPATPTSSVGSKGGGTTGRRRPQGKRRVTDVVAAALEGPPSQRETRRDKE